MHPRSGSGRPAAASLALRAAFVAAFIGSPPINLLGARRAAGGLALADAGILPLSSARDLPQALLVGIRPEDLKPCGEAEAQLSLVADIVEAQGPETIVHGAAQGLRLTVRLDGRTAVAPGEAIPLRVAEEALHLFDQADRRRLAA